MKEIVEKKVYEFFTKSHYSSGPNLAFFSPMDPMFLWNHQIYCQAYGNSEHNKKKTAKILKGKKFLMYLGEINRTV